MKVAHRIFSSAAQLSWFERVWQTDACLFVYLLLHKHQQLHWNDGKESSVVPFHYISVDARVVWSAQYRKYMLRLSYSKRSKLCLIYRCRWTFRWRCVSTAMCGMAPSRSCGTGSMTAPLDTILKTFIMWWVVGYLWCAMMMVVCNHVAMKKYVCTNVFEPA